MLLAISVEENKHSEFAHPVTEVQLVKGSGA